MSVSKKEDAEIYGGAFGQNVLLKVVEHPNIPDAGQTFHGTRDHLWGLAQQHENVTISLPNTTKN